MLEMEKPMLNTICSLVLEWRMSSQHVRMEQLLTSHPDASPELVSAVYNGILV